MRYRSPQVAANETTDRHKHTVIPVHITFDHEHQNRRSSHAKSKEILKRDDMPNISPRDWNQKQPEPSATEDTFQLAPTAPHGRRIRKEQSERARGLGGHRCYDKH